MSLKPYRERTTLQSRVNDTARTSEKYPDRIATLCEAYDPKYKIPKIKFLIPFDLTVGHFILHIRRYLKNLNETQAIFLFIGEQQKVYSSGFLFSEIIKESGTVGPDGFLYIQYALENTYGNKKK